MDRRELGKSIFGRLNDLRDTVAERGGRVVEKQPQQPRESYRPEFRVLSYRRFWPPSPALRERFEAQMDHLHNNHVVRGLPEMMLDQRSGRVSPDGTICITIDGGHRDFFGFAYPVLRARGLSATLFLPTTFLDGGWLWFDRIIYALRHTRAASFLIELPDGDHIQRTLDTPAEKRAASGTLIQTLQRLPQRDAEPLLNGLLAQLGVEVPDDPPEEFAALRWDEANEMWPNNISYGAQLVTHPPMVISAVDEEVRCTLIAAKERIAEKLGDYEIMLSYPNGPFDERIVQIAKQCGYLGAVGNEPGPNTTASDTFRIRRISVDPSMDFEQFAKFCAAPRRA